MHSGSRFLFSVCNRCHPTSRYELSFAFLTPRSSANYQSFLSFEGPFFAIRSSLIFLSLSSFLRFSSFSTQIRTLLFLFFALTFSLFFLFASLSVCFSGILVFLFLPFPIFALCIFRFHLSPVSLQMFLVSISLFVVSFSFVIFFQITCHVTKC